MSSGSSCTSRFISSEDIKEPATNIASVIPAELQDQDTFFEDIKIKCNGTIKSVLIGAKHDDTKVELPVLQLWHCGNYSAPYLEIRLNNSYMDKDGVSWYNISQPIVISSGHVLLLGIYQPNCSNAQTCIYYQKFSGPENFYVNNNDNSKLESANRNHYPLISIVFGNCCYIIIPANL